MARRIRTTPHPNRPEEIRASIERLLDTPLHSIAEQLHDQLEFLATSARDNARNEEILKVFLSQARAVLRLIPETFGDRFWFDAQMIDGLTWTSL